MRLLSLWQPWASFVAWKFKGVETRSWTTPYRGPVAIHAAQTREASDPDYVDELLERAGVSVAERARFATTAMPYGAVVALADLVDSFKVSAQASLRSSAFEMSVSQGGRTTTIATAARDEVTLYGEDGRARRVARAETALGDLGPGRGALVLASVRTLREPLRMRGEQGLRPLITERQLEVRARAEPRRVRRLADLERASKVGMKYRCPVAGCEGLLVLRRDEATARILPEDACVLCGERVFYEDLP